LKYNEGLLHIISGWRYGFLRHFLPLLSTPAFSTLAILPVSHFTLPHFSVVPLQHAYDAHFFQLAILTSKLYRSH